MKTRQHNVTQLASWLILLFILNRFHGVSMTGKLVSKFPGLPGRVGTLTDYTRDYPDYLWKCDAVFTCHIRVTVITSAVTQL